MQLRLQHVTTLREAIARATSEDLLARLDESGKAQIESALAEVERFAASLERLMQTSLDVVATIGHDGRIMGFSHDGPGITGYEPEELIGRCYDVVIHPEDRAIAAAAMVRALHGEVIRGLQLRSQRKDGTLVWLEWNAAVLPDEGVLCASARDITMHKQNERLLRESEQLYRSLFDYSPDAIFSLDCQGRFLSINPACEEIVGRSLDELLGRAFSPLVVPELRNDAIQHFHRCLEGEAQNFDTATLHRQGHRVELNVTGVPIMENSRIVGVYAIAKDITERKLAEEQLAHLAFHDPLTGLANRSLFMNRLEQVLARTARDQPSLGILYLDLDDFKVVNDSLGHRAGDAILIDAAKRLLSCVAPRDTVARLGGDEFVVLVAQTNDTDDAIRVAESILQRLSEPFQIDGRKMVVTPSVGVVMGNQGSDAKELLRHADIAMYQAKLRGKARYEAFTPVMYSHALQRLDLETSLRRAVERDEFRVFYQPVIDLTTGLISGVEALVRWEDPQRGLTSPAQFIPVAEETGLILPIGKWVLREACRQVRDWKETYHPTMTLSVNLSVKQFNEPFLADEVANVLKETGFDSASLQLEITETVLMKDAETTQDTLRVLKNLGIGLSMDDFGTGYSSLSYLKRFPIDILKVDRSFVIGLGQSKEDDALVQTVIHLSKALHLTVTAEGIETEDQLAILRAMGCERGQGYHFAKPLTNTDMTSLLAAQRRW